MMTDADYHGWRCAGCGQPHPDKIRACDCPTSALYDRENLKAGAGKIDAPQGDTVLTVDGNIAALLIGDAPWRIRIEFPDGPAYWFVATKARTNLDGLVTLEGRVMRDDAGAGRDGEAQ